MKYPPKLVRALTFGHDAWVVGSGAAPNSETPRDWDVLVPFSHWQAAAFLIPPDAKPNSFGGFKCISYGVEIDVWPGDLGQFLSMCAPGYAWHPKTNTRLQKGTM